MSPRAELYAAADDMADWAQTNRFAAIACGLPDLRSPATRAHVATLATARIVYAPEPAENYDRKEARAEGIRHALNSQDSESVLDALVEAGDVDSEAIETMLAEACEKRLMSQRPTPRSTMNKELLKAVEALIEACDDSLDRSTRLQGAKANLHTLWCRAGGALL